MFNFNLERIVLQVQCTEELTEQLAMESFLQASMKFLNVDENFNLEP